jgi:hypothetical protein
MNTATQDESPWIRRLVGLTLSLVLTFGSERRMGPYSKAARWLQPAIPGVFVWEVQHAAHLQSS